MNLPKLDRHIFLTSSSEIDVIIKPLKDFFGFTSFVYQKNFLDGSEIRLSNQPQWIQFFFENELYKKSVFEHTPTEYKKCRLLWSGLTHHNAVLDKAREFKIDHGVTLIEPQKDGCEFFFIGTTPDHPEATTRYLNNPELLDKFIDYFREKAAPLIKKAAENRIIIPSKIIEAPKLSYDLDIDMQLFLSALHHKTLAHLTPRELECLRWLLKGYTQKMIANELHISERTVETHLIHVKEKTNLKTKAQLIKSFSVF